jgi:electron transport complex protein RnfC
MFGFSKVKGGVHPDGRKDLSAARPIKTDIALPPKLLLPLYQQSGVEGRPIVKAGDQVLKGQCVSVSSGTLSANLHAPTSGKILGIEEIVAPHPSGLKAGAIILEPDGDDRWIDLNPFADPFNEDPELLAARVAEAGIVGMGGAIFPAAVKLRQGRRFEIRTLLINGGECEPYLTTDDRLMRERAADLIDGVRLIRYIIEAYKAVICIEDNKPEAIAAIREAAAPHGYIEVEVVPSMYPMGSAKQMIQAVTGLEVPAGKRSNDLGVLVHNVGTVFAIQQALRFGKPLISRVSTVSGSCVAQPQNVEALIGTPVRHLIESCGGLTEKPARLLLGGPMMGQVLSSFDVPMIKGGSGVLALSQNEVNQRTTSPCIRCARCVSACPMGLMPLEMARHAKADDFEGAQDYGLKDCILCGSCAYVCPSHIPLVQYFEYAKGELGDRRRGEQKLAYTQKLTAARDARLEKEAAEKAAAKKKKRKSKAAPAKKADAQTENQTETPEKATEEA